MKKLKMSDFRKEVKRLENSNKRKEKGNFKKEYLNVKKEMFLRDEGKCVFCKTEVSKDHYQTCHIIPKEFKETHNDIDNLLLACFYHHKVGKYSMHNNPLWFCQWFRLNYPQRYDYLITKLKELEIKYEKEKIEKESL